MYINVVFFRTMEISLGTPNVLRIRLYKMLQLLTREPLEHPNSKATPSPGGTVFLSMLSHASGKRFVGQAHKLDQRSLARSNDTTRTNVLPSIADTYGGPSCVLRMINRAQHFLDPCFCRSCCYFPSPLRQRD